jgi:predicted ribosome quality control (RQC) complex YloA/Tae2 family protein
MADPLIFIGKNKKHNFELLDAAAPTDIWFHLGDRPSTHVILKTDVRLNAIPRQLIKRCARLCLPKTQKIEKSEAVKAEKTQTVIYTEVANVKKTVILGQVTLEGPSKKINIRI